MQPPRERNFSLYFAGGLFFCSGLSALLFQTLWMRKLGWLLGGTATSAAVVLTVFFGGLALGGWLGGRTGATSRPLRTYALLELGVAASALLFLALEPVFLFAYAALVAVSQQASWLYPAAAFLVVSPLLLPASTAMGATLPVVSGFLKREQDDAGGGRVAFVYAANVLGGATGVVLATFFLPQALGYTGAYLCGVGLALLIGIVAFLYDRSRAGAEPPVQKKKNKQNSPVFDPALTRTLAFASGFVVLAMEVMAMRLFARVLQNSIYTYAVVLVAVLLGLGAGAFAATRVRDARAGMRWAMLSGSLLLACAPFFVHWITGGLGYIGGGSDWPGYLGKIGALSGLVLSPPAFALGLVFPLLLSAAGGDRAEFSRRVGDLVAINTVGGICGSAAAGFVLLPLLGLYDSMRLIAFVYPLLMLAFLSRSAWRLEGPPVWMLIFTIFLMIGVFDPGRLPAVRYDPDKGESLLESREGPRGQAAVLRTEDGLRIKLDNHYTIGSSGARAAEERQSHLPLLLHPDPRRVFVIGLGTGITAGAVLRHPVREVTVAELVPEILELSRRHFKPYTGGLFEDERVRLVAADGRWLLRAETRTYDVILGDLFTPWKAGVGDLYAREHFATARDRLAPGGLFAQWLPLYQMTANEYGTVARTMLEVFPRVTVWRGDFFPDRNIVALVGHRDRTPFDPEPARLRLERAREDARGQLRELAPALAALRGARDRRREPLSSLLMYFGGDLTTRKGDFLEFPLNTDDRPVIQWRAPISLRRVRSGRDSWLVGPALLREFDLNFGARPPGTDDYLSRLSSRERRFTRAGLLLHRMVVWKEAGVKDRALIELRELKRLLE